MRALPHSLSLILFTAASVFADPPAKVVDLASDPAGVTRIYGSVGDGSYGVPVCGGHDCDGDGFLDVAFASFLAAPLGRTRAGEVALVFRDGTVGDDVDTAGFSGDWLKVAGGQLHEICGAEIWMDDVTGDGVGDLIIGRQNFSPDASRSGAGALTIIPGGPALRAHAAGGAYLDLAPIPFPGLGLPRLDIYGISAYDRLGVWMRTGDVDGDGVADILVGADQVDKGGSANAGACWLIRGGPWLAGAAVADLSDTAGSPLAGRVLRIDAPDASVNFHLGGTVQLADLDGNGRCELLMGATIFRAGAALFLPGTPSGAATWNSGAPRGRVYILWDDGLPALPWSNGETVDLETAPTGVVSEIRGEAANERFGEEIIGDLDLDMDGDADLFVGDLAANTVNGFDSGLGHILFQAHRLRGQVIDLAAESPPGALTRILGPIAGAIGNDTVAVGDFDGDGGNDLALGNPHDRPLGRFNGGTVHVLYARPGPWPALLDLGPTDALPPASDIRIGQLLGAKGRSGTDQGDTLCYSASAADLDGDGRDDLIINEMQGNGVLPTAEDVGNLLLISGRAILPQQPQLTAQGIDGGDLELAIQTDAGTWILQESGSLDLPSWINLQTNVYVEGSTNLLLPGNAAPARRFYRLIEAP